jgi:hypothetical protein
VVGIGHAEQLSRKEAALIISEASVRIRCRPDRRRCHATSVDMTLAIHIASNGDMTILLPARG